MNINELTSLINEAIVNEWSSWDSAEAAEQRRKNAELKKKMMAQRGIIDDKKKPKAKLKEVSPLQHLMDELKMYFCDINGKGAISNDSARALHQFIRFTSLNAEKNTAGGAFLTGEHKFGANVPREYANIYANIRKIMEPIGKIRLRISRDDTADSQNLLMLSYDLQDFIENLGIALHEILQDPIVRNGDSKFMNGFNHNVGFKDILKQMNKDYKNAVYHNLLMRIKEAIKEVDPFAYKEPKLVGESQLRKLVRESLMEYTSLNNSDSLYCAYEKMKELMGAEQLLDELVQAMNDNELRENLEWIDRNNDLGVFNEEPEQEDEF